MDRQPRDGLGVARTFFRRLDARRDPGAAPAYGIVNWNYMPPAGGTQVHPHLQVIYTRNPGNRLRRELAAERTYRERFGRIYLADLLAREQTEGVRWIGELGAVAWFAPFVPTGLLGDGLGVFPNRAKITDLSDQDITDFAGGLRRILKGFAAIGLWSFNLVFFPAGSSAEAEHHWLNVRLVPRFYLNSVIHVPDVSYLQLQMEERLAMVYPEETAARLRVEFEA